MHGFTTLEFRGMCNPNCVRFYSERGTQVVKQAKKIKKMCINLGIQEKIKQSLSQPVTHTVFKNFF